MSFNISQDGMHLSAQAYEPGTADAAILVRATLHAPTTVGDKTVYRTCVSSGFDLTADSAEKLAQGLVKLAAELRAAEEVEA